MLYHIAGIKIPFQEDQTEALYSRIIKKGFARNGIVSYRILKRSLDSRRKNDIHYLYQVEIEYDGALSREAAGVAAVISEPEVFRRPIPVSGRVAVIGAGPGGLFAALSLARMGFNPVIIERGKKVDQRSIDVQRFWTDAVLNEDSNMQFGEGGAGTFSDGKLTTRIQNPRIHTVFKELVAAGAPPEILYDYKPHIGTDLLVTVVANLRRKIEQLGGVFRFETRLTDWVERDGSITELILSGGERLPVGLVFLATGHSARDTYALLHRKGTALATKSFAVGTRIQHPQELIQRMQYGPHWDNPKLPTASYRFSHSFRSGGEDRGVFSFCMCPGGEVVSAASEHGCSLVNGMSNSARDGRFANSAIVVAVGPRDYGSDLMDGLRYQRNLEQQHYNAAGYGAVFQRLEDFRCNKASRGGIESSFRMELAPGNLQQTLPDEVVQGLLSGFSSWSRVKSFIHPDAVLIGHETRTSSPLRILRDARGFSISHDNLLPVGEGAGYAGGIVSAAVDGIRAVESACTSPVVDTA